VVYDPPDARRAGAGNIARTDSAGQRPAENLLWEGAFSDRIPRRYAMAERKAGGRDDSGGVLVLVCMTCGHEYTFGSGETPPDDLRCEKCDSTVFRRFDDAPVPDEARADFRDQTERDLAPDDPEGDATAGDLHDLNP
jgi:DNA-directed RNA polymerase subunit RPC12/RpoP